MSEDYPSHSFEPRPAPQMHVLAILSLAVGIFGLLAVVLCAPLGIIFGAAAAVCGHIALAQIKRDPDYHEGYGIALAGTIIGYVAFVITVLMVAAFLVFALWSSAPLEEFAR